MKRTLVPEAKTVGSGCVLFSSTYFFLLQKKIILNEDRFYSKTNLRRQRNRVRIIVRIKKRCEVLLILQRFFSKIFTRKKPA
jgi:hypothetical protein